MDPYVNLSEKEANAYAREHVDREAHAAILSGSFTLADMRAWRKSLGLSQQRLSRMLGYEASYISNIENGKNNPGHRYLMSFRANARKLESGLFSSRASEKYLSHAFVERKFLAGQFELRKCAHPKCGNMRYMTPRRRYCSDTCRQDAHYKGLSNAAHSLNKTGAARSFGAGPITAVCPHCGERFPTKGNTQRSNSFESNGGRADLP